MTLSLIVPFFCFTGMLISRSHFTGFRFLGDFLLVLVPVDDRGIYPLQTAERVLAPIGNPLPVSPSPVRTQVVGRLPPLLAGKHGCGQWGNVEGISHKAGLPKFRND